ncbi:MAG: hypothetical protein PHS17_13760 [Desulfobacterales bacterium]|nr:hypothetical protein [Desulfobacterales bacterium]
MKIERLKLKGFTGIRKGLGLDEISLDLSGLSGLCALAGPNGKGKSTLLESLSPFRTLASRKGALQKHVFLRDSEKALSFRWNGDLYETLVKIDCQSGRGEAFIYKNGVPEIKGKSSEYDRYMVELLGSPELFFASVFCAQNSEKLSDMKPFELKNLFSEFLRLDALERYEEASKQRRNTMTTQAEALENERKYLEGEVSKKTDLEALHWGKDSLLKGRLETFAKTKAQTIILEDSLKALRARVESNKIHEARLKDLQAAGKKLADDWQKEKTAGEKAIAELRVKADQVAREIAATSKLIERKDAIEKATTRETEINKELQKSNETLAACSEKINAMSNLLRAYEKQKAEIMAKLRELKTDEQAAKLRNTVASLKEKKTLLDKKDPACTSRTCAFIVNALKAEELPTIEKALSDRESLLMSKNRTLTDDITLLDGQIKEASQKKTLQEKAGKDVALIILSLKKELESTRALSALKSQLDTATAKLEGLEKRHFDLEGDILSEENFLLMRKLEFEGLFKKNVDLIQETQGQLDIMAATDLEAEETSLKDLLAAKESTEKEIGLLRADLSALEAQIRDLEEKERRLQEIQAKRTVIISEASEWEYLKDACSAKGLRALEIDSVAPTISAYANDLLSRTFGPLFQVRFRTQNDEGKEVLDILVIRDDGTETLLENLSGGEKVWLLKALRLSMMLVSKEKSGRAYASLFCDEEDGPLSSENAVHFINLYRSCMTAAKMETCFYISHRPEAIAMADYTLQFNGKGIEIQ